MNIAYFIASRVRYFNVKGRSRTECGNGRRTGSGCARRWGCVVRMRNGMGTVRSYSRTLGQQKKMLLEVLCG